MQTVQGRLLGGVGIAQALGANGFNGQPGFAEEGFHIVSPELFLDNLLNIGNLGQYKLESRGDKRCTLRLDNCHNRSANRRQQHVFVGFL